MPPPTPRDNRAEAREQRRHLEVPSHGLGRAEIIRSRSPSPAATASGAFRFPPPPPEEDQFVDAPTPNTNMATEEQLAAIREQLRAEMRAEVRNESAAAAAATPDAIKRKPEIPQFDKENVEVWIRRTENAFIRALITSPREKFAFLEAKFPCNFNSRINEFLWGDPTAENYEAFLNYLRKEYGPTKQQKAAIVLDGFKRDGRKPSQYVAALVEKTKDLTLDDIHKEMLVREMPVEIRRMLQERIENESLEDAAKAADAYFDQEGRPRFQSSSINNVQHAEFETNSEDDGVNAVGGRFQKKPFGPKKQSFSRPPQKGWHAPTAKKPQQTPTPQQAPKPQQNNDLCYYHDRFGNKSTRCEVGCKLFDANRFPGNAKAGHK